MHLTTRPGRFAAGLTTFAAVASLGGTAAVMATRTGSHQGQHARAVAATGPASMTGVMSAPTVTQRPTMPSSHPLGATARPTRPARPLTAAQAAALAASATRAHVDEVEAATGPVGTTYDVKLVRPDGSNVEVLVVARTGQVSVAGEQDKADPAAEGAAGLESVPNEPDHPSDRSDH